METKSARVEYDTFVLAPTQGDYSEVKSKEDLSSELDELTRMGEKDIAFLSTSKKLTVYPEVIPTGHPNQGKLAERFEALSKGEGKVVVVFTAHGSPGPRGKIGMGNDEEGKADYRLTIDMLVDLLVKSGIGALVKRDVSFTFRCCNSAYCPVEIYAKLKQEQIEKVAEDVRNSSVIGLFYARMQKVGFASLSVTGYRGFYFPDKKAPQVSTNAKDKFPLADGEITISGKDVVSLPANFHKLKSTTKLDKYFRK